MNTNDTERQRLQDLADRLLHDTAHQDDADPDDGEILDLLSETFGMTRVEVLDRLARMDLAALCEETA